jgi:GTP-binding protein
VRRLREDHGVPDREPVVTAARSAAKGRPGPAPSAFPGALPDGQRIVEAKFVAALGIDGGALPAPTFTEIAFAGRSNVGKSSLINSLVERRGLVRTSSTPGCTRQVNVFETRAKDGTVLNLVDLPGYGFARRSHDERRAWAELIEGYLATRPSLAALCLLVDARRGLEDDDRELLDFVKRGRAGGLRQIEATVVATKADKLPKSSAKAMLAKLQQAAGVRVTPFSAMTGDGRVALWASIRRAALGIAPRPAADPEATPAPEAREGVDGPSVPAATGA